MTALGIGLATGPSLFTGEGEAELLTPPHENADVLPGILQCFVQSARGDRAEGAQLAKSRRHNNLYEFSITRSRCWQWRGSPTRTRKAPANAAGWAFTLGIAIFPGSLYIL